jgi:L-lactate dehydrogenase (cytochrome)
VLNVLRAPRRTFGNLVGLGSGGSNLSTLSQWIASQFDPTLSWKDVAWVRKLWPGKLIIKGILDADDARLAVDTGADAIVVSNHGGRQLDGAPSSIAALPGIVAAVGTRPRYYSMAVRSCRMFSRPALARRAPWPARRSFMVWARWGKPVCALPWN